MGVVVERLSKNAYTFEAKEINLDYLISEEFKKKSGKLRGSVMLAGPLLARYKKAYIPQPGGDKIGRRKPDQQTQDRGTQRLCNRADKDGDIGPFNIWRIIPE